MYHLAKRSRHYLGNPYQGPANDNKPAIAYTLEEAKALRIKLGKRNPIGFDIYDAKTGEFVDWRK